MSNIGGGVRQKDTPVITQTLYTGFVAERSPPVIELALQNVRIQTMSDQS